MKRGWRQRLIGTTLVGVGAQVGALWAAPAAEPDPIMDGGLAQPRGRIDELVWARLAELKIAPARDCSDSVFVRRAYLDVIGTLPTDAEVIRFLRDPSTDRRAKLIDALLERDEFADYWAMKWCDLLRVKAEFPVNLWPNGVQAYHRWLRDSIRQNLPYDQFARALLTTSGSNFRDPPVNFYRAAQEGDPLAVAQAVALTFMGVRPDRLSPQALGGLAAFFTKIEFKSTGEWKESILVFNPARVCTNPAVTDAPMFPDSTPAKIAAGQDPRRVFADWLIRPSNPWFARAIANRVWAWLFGRGIVHEPDDFRDDNPPSNPALLAYLATRLPELGWDQKAFMREILNSQTYQLSPIPATDHPQALAQFAHYSMRRLEAEVFMDALCMITGTSEEYQSPIPEPFTWVPRTVRTIQLADGSISSPFLEMFGRPPRDTGLMSERSNRITPDQRLHLLNSTHIRRKIEQGPKLASMYGISNQEEMVRRIYLTVLSREPTTTERKRIEAYSRAGAARGREVAIDLVWALINSSEFLYRH